MWRKTLLAVTQASGLGWFGVSRPTRKIKTIFQPVDQSILFLFSLEGTDVQITRLITGLCARSRGGEKSFFVGKFARGLFSV